MMSTMIFSTNVSEFCYSDTGPSALPYRLTKSCTFRDSMERTKNCIEETDVFIFSKHHIQLELDLLNLLGEAGDAKSRVRHASGEPPGVPGDGLQAADLGSGATLDLGRVEAAGLLGPGLVLGNAVHETHHHPPEDEHDGHDGDEEADEVDTGLNVSREGEAAAVDISSDSLSDDMAKVQSEARISESFLDASSAWLGGRGRLHANVAHCPESSLLEGQAKTGLEVVITHPCPRIQFIIYICFCRYDRSQVKSLAGLCTKHINPRRSASKYSVW